MRKMTGAQALVETLERHGLKYVFGNPGSSYAPTLDSIIGSHRLKFILGMQEGTVMGMADGYAKATGAPSVAMVHTIAGLSNSLGGIYNAYVDGTPIVVIAGNQDAKMLGRTSFCEAPDLTGVPRQFVKMSQEITAPDRIQEIMGRALRVAGSRPAGPCFLSISKDVQTPEVTGADDPGRDLMPMAIRPDGDRIRTAAEILVKAERPVLIAGFDIAKDGAQREVVQLAELLGCPVLWEERTNLGGMAFPTDHPQYLGPFEPDMQVVQNADVLLAIGKKLFAEFAFSEKSRLPQSAQLIHLHENPWEIGKMHAPAVGILADTKLGSRDLLMAVQVLAENDSVFANTSQKRRQQAGEMHLALKQRMEKQVQAVWEDAPIKADRLAKEIAGLMKPGMTIVNESTRSFTALLNHVDFNEPQSFYACPGGHLGWGLPAALGIKLALPHRKVLAFLGDGSSMYTIQALFSAVRYRLPVVAVICNNASYLAVKAHLNSMGGNASQKGVFEGAELMPRVSYARLAEGFGAKGYTVTEPGQIRPVLQEALDKNEAAVVDVIIDATIPPATK